MKSNEKSAFLQFLNILRGEMSAVGPRPERPEFVEELAREIPFYRVRHAVKPGMAGWALVKQGYGASKEDALLKSQYDLYIGPERVGELLNGGEAGVIEEAVGAISMAERVEIWNRALYAIQDFPFTGCGLGAFRRVVWILYPLFTIPPDNDIGHAHNIFLQTALDVGIPGLIAYLALLFIAGAVCWRAARRGDPLTRPMAIGLAAGLLALHAYGMTDALALGSKPAVVFWFALGLVAALEGAGQGDKPSNR